MAHSTNYTLDGLVTSTRWLVALVSIGSEYPFNIFDRSRLLGGDVTSAVKLHLGAVSLCSFTTVIGYGSLLFADNQALRSFGKLAIAGEISCVLAALLFLPALLHLLARGVGGRSGDRYRAAARERVFGPMTRVREVPPRR